MKAIAGRAYGAAVNALPPALVLVALIVAWQAYVDASGISRVTLPSPARIADGLWTNRSVLSHHAWVTLQETLIGLVVSIALGVLLALFIESFGPVRRALYPLLVGSQTIPVVVIAPLLALWFGFGVASKIIMATIAIFFPVASAFADGLSRADANLLDLAQLYQARRWQVVWLIRVPGAVPALVTGLRLAAVYAPIGALFGEWVGASSGLGYAMLFANARAQTDVMFAALILLVAMSVILRAAVDLATSNLTPWRAESQ